MFDQPTPPTNLPTKEPEDMFGAVESASAPTPPPPPAQTPPTAEFQAGKLLPPALEAPAEIKAPLVSSRKVIVIGGVVLGVLIVGGVAYGVLRFVRQAAAPSIPPQEIPVPADLTPLPAPVVEPLSPAPVPEPTPPSPPPAPTDTDGDGLTDEEEAALGTQPNNPDSDTDGLFDNEEVKTYHTDPLKPDTDGDTYLDGQEVRAGYNPKGPGKLFSVPAGQ